MKKQIETRQANEPVVVDPVLQRNGLKQLEQAVELIPNCQKEAYLEAKIQCPLLVEKEPGLIRFLEYEKFDVWAAARRLVTYWTMRKNLFEERAFLPMHQTGNGALSEIDLEVLATGFATILPAKNVNGDTFVLTFIPSRLDKENDIIASRRRCTFYIMSVIMNLNPASKNTFSGIMMLNQVGFQRAMLVKPTVKMIQQLPIYSDYGVVAHCPMDVERKTFFEMVAPTIMKLFERDGGHKSSGVVDTVSASSRQDLANQLAACGFNQDSLPTECGGTWSVEKFRQWQLERMELERQRELKYFGVARRISACASVSIGDPESEKFAVALQRPPSLLATMDELDNRWEWENLADAPLPISPTVALNELERSLEWENPGMMPQIPSFPSATISGFEQQNFDNGQLDDSDAKKPAACASTMEYNRRVAEAFKEDEWLRDTYNEAERLERKRILDREHSKRKRAKRKDCFAALQESHVKCVAENARLKKESTFLKRLIREAKKVIKYHLSGNADYGAVLTDRQSVAVESSAVNQRETGNDDGSVSIGNLQSVVTASPAPNQDQPENDDGYVSVGHRQSVVAVSSTANHRQSGNDERSVSIDNRKSVVVESSPVNQRQMGIYDGSLPIDNLQSVVVASTTANQPPMGIYDGSVSIGNRQSVVAASSTANRYHHDVGHDGSTPPVSLPESFLPNSSMNRHSPLTTAGGGAGMNESIHNQFPAAGSLPTWFAPFSCPNSLLARQREVTNNDLLLYMLQQQQQHEQQQQQQQLINSFLQRDAGLNATNSDILLNIMMQQRLLAAQSQQQPLVYPSVNNPPYQNNNNHPSTTAAPHHQSLAEEKSDDTPTHHPGRSF